MWKLIIKNFWIKLFCLVAATCLWIYIAAGQNSVGKFPGSIKIKAINVPSGLVATYDAKTVDIKIMADPSVWRKLSADTFSAYIDLSAHSEGTYELNVNVVSSEQGVQIVEKNPDKIFVSLEPIISKEVNLNTKIEGNAGEGLVAGSITLEPSKVQVRGPKSLVENLTEATTIIKLSGETEDFIKNVSITAFNENGEEISDLDFIPNEVKATVPIIKASNNKTVGVKAKVTGFPKTGYFVSSIAVTPSTVDVTGIGSVLAEVDFVETMAVDITNLSTNTEKEVMLDIKNGIALQSNSPTKVNVKIEFARTETTKELSATVATKNLDSSYFLSSVNQNQIRVLVSGPVDVVNSLKSSDIILQLDFQNVKANAGSSFNFDITPKNISAPDGISILSVVPSSINATLEKKH